MISADDLIAGAEAEVQVDIPEALLPDVDDRTLTLRPLTARDLRLIARATRESDDLSAVLMVQQALVEPALTPDQVNALPAGLLQFLVQNVNRISGITASEDDVLHALEDPLVQASMLLSREMGWTPQEVGQLTLGEMMLHVASLKKRGA